MVLRLGRLAFVWPLLGCAAGRALDKRILEEEAWQAQLTVAFKRLQEMESSLQPPTQVKSHPGIIVAIIVVAFLAFLAAVFIVKKYCFTESNVTYRYSVLRSYQEADDLGNSTTNRLQNDDSDEDLLD
ncbi:sortilin-like isoform X1 [Rhinatrema bivittatum]|uniref:sortilin-like isoform X1 n=1 Tax=Rhinatrema bivittatum TaxID=194408 RepID=UPI00112AFE06|nr:sortilin-like isoform X1 [Rhinatrema bivittatum]